LNNESLSSPSEDKNIFRNKTLLQNILFLQEFKNLDEYCIKNKIPRPIGLKGISLLHRIYKVDERSLTDIDVLYGDEHLPHLHRAFESLGYTYRQESSWFANNYKFIFVKKMYSLEVVFEVHTRLLPTEPREHRWETLPTNNGLSLAPIDEILYLSFHYANQHTFLKTFWLRDIFLLSNQTEVWTSDVWTKAKDLGLFPSLVFTAQALNVEYGLMINIPDSLSKYLSMKLINIEFIQNPHRRLLKYYIVKHFTKKNIFSALYYDVFWLLFKIKNGLKL
jgi:hypothetical protein